MALAAVPFIVKLRRFNRIIPAHPTAPLATSLAQDSARHLTRCIRVIQRQKHDATLSNDFSQLAGCSHRDFVHQCSSYWHDAPNSLICHRDQASLVAAVVALDPSRRLVEALAVEKMIPLTATLVRSTRDLRNPCPEEDSDSDGTSAGWARGVYDDWFDEMITMWRRTLERAAEASDAAIAIQAVDCNLLFLLEWWCHHYDSMRADGMWLRCQI